MYGTALGWTQYNASANGGGSGGFNFNPPHGTVLEPGAGQSLTVTWEPQDPWNYNSASKTVTIDVVRATPAITWANPATIVYGTALSGTQLNASSPVSGTFAYAQPAGTVLSAGSSTLSVTFTPADPVHYETVTATATIIVTKATPVITWPSIANVTYPTALSATQLNATANVDGAMTYSQADGAVLNTGGHTITATFAPSDATNYNNASASRSLVVEKGHATVTWSNPANINYPTPLSATQLNATADVPGTFTYSQAIGTVLPSAQHWINVTFVPEDAANYSGDWQQVSFSVLKGMPVVTWDTPAPIAYGTALSATQLNATASVPGCSSTRRRPAPCSAPAVPR